MFALQAKPSTVEILEGIDKVCLPNNLTDLLDFNFIFALICNSRFIGNDDFFFLHGLKRVGNNTSAMSSFIGC